MNEHHSVVEYLSGPEHRSLSAKDHSRARTGALERPDGIRGTGTHVLRVDTRSGHHAERVLEKLVENLERRVETVEQIVPTLATKADINAYVKEDGEQTRRHIGIVFESLRADVRLIAEDVTALQASTC